MECHEFESQPEQFFCFGEKGVKKRVNVLGVIAFPLS